MLIARVLVTRKQMTPSPLWNPYFPADLSFLGNGTDHQIAAQHILVFAGAGRFVIRIVETEMRHKRTTGSYTVFRFPNQIGLQFFLSFAKRIPISRTPGSPSFSDRFHGLRSLLNPSSCVAKN